MTGYVWVFCKTTAEENSGGRFPRRLGGNPGNELPHPPATLGGGPAGVAGAHPCFSRRENVRGLRRACDR